MTDGIIKSAGNSRYLKTVPNALTLYDTHEKLVQALVEGTFPIDLNGINPSGWDVIGDKLGKETLLTDALCTALGLPTTATPTQAMDKLRQLVNAAQSTADAGLKTALGSYSGTYTSGTSTTKTLTLPFASKVVLVAGNSIAFFVYPCNSSVSMPGNSDRSGLLGVAWDGNSLSWSAYNSYGNVGGWGLNQSGTNYFYIAIG